MIRISLILGGLILAANLFAQSGQGLGKNYDVSKVVTVSGKVTEVMNVAHNGPGHGVHLMLEVGDEVLMVLLGPSFYLEKQSVKVEKGYSITVIGSKSGKTVIAREVTKAGSTLKLRTEAGAPLWGRGSN